MLSLSKTGPKNVFSLKFIIKYSENGRILSAVDVMRDLVRRGVDQAEFLPRTDLEIRQTEQWEHSICVTWDLSFSGRRRLCWWTTLTGSVALSSQSYKVKYQAKTLIHLGLGAWVGFIVRVLYLFLCAIQSLSQSLSHCLHYASLSGEAGGLGVPHRQHLRPGGLCQQEKRSRVQVILASDWSILITWPEYWPLIG